MEGAYTYDCLVRELDRIFLSPKILRYCLSLTRNLDDAEDLRQDSYIRARKYIRKKGSFQIHALERLTIKVIRSVHINGIRKNRFSRIRTLNPNTGNISEEGQIDSITEYELGDQGRTLEWNSRERDALKEYLSLLQPAIQKTMTQDEEEMVIQRKVEKKKYEEIASSMGMSVADVKSRIDLALRRAKYELQDSIKEYWRGKRR
jgi:RNA polymerase sigma factor (sigma-70 family)